MKWLSENLSHIYAVVFGLIAVLFLGLFAYLLVNGRDGQILSLVAALVCILAARFADIVSFSIGTDGLKADLTKRIREAEVTLEQFQKLSVTWARIALEHLHGSRYTNKIRYRDIAGFTEEIRQALHGDADGLNLVNETTYRWDCFHYSQELIQPAIREMDSNVVFAFLKPFQDAGNNPASSEWQEFVRQQALGGTDLLEALEDLRFYEQNRRHRRGGMTW